MRAHGAPHLIAHLAGRLTLEEAADRGKLDTRQYATRQFTWARHQMAGFEWVAPNEAAKAGERALRVLVGA
jgi:tRNA dimethylallyltransferase